MYCRYATSVTAHTHTAKLIPRRHQQETPAGDSVVVSLSWPAQEAVRIKAATHTPTHTHTHRAEEEAAQWLTGPSSGRDQNELPLSRTGEVCV